MLGTSEVVSEAIMAGEAIGSSCPRSSATQFCDSLLAPVVRRGSLQWDRGRFLPRFMT